MLFKLIHSCCHDITAQPATNTVDWAIWVIVAIIIIYSSLMDTHWSTHYHADVPHPTNGSVSVMPLHQAGKVRVTWSRPILGPGQVITGYSVQYRRRGTTSYITRSVSGSYTTSYTITNLFLGAVYEVRVASIGILGLSGYCCGSGKQVTTYNSEWTV